MGLFGGQMIEMRWLEWTESVPMGKNTYNVKQHRKLQYRQLEDITVRAGMPTPEQVQATANYQWSRWTDVPSVMKAD